MLTGRHGCGLRALSLHLYVADGANMVLSGKHGCGLGALSLVTYPTSNSFPGKCQVPSRSMRSAAIGPGATQRLVTLCPLVLARWAGHHAGVALRLPGTAAWSPEQGPHEKAGVPYVSFGPQAGPPSPATSCSSPRAMQTRGTRRQGAGLAPASYPHSCNTALSHPC